jgi:hypothetical protein
LLAKPEEEIRQLWERERERERAEAAAAIEVAERGLYYMKPMPPDYDHYCKCATWTLEEALALSFGRDPEKLSSAGLVEYAKRGYPFAKSYRNRWVQIQRAKATQQLFDPVFPSIFLAWAKTLKLVMPEELLSRAVASGISLKNWQTLYEDSVALRAKLDAQHKENVGKWREALDAARSENAKLKSEAASQVPVGPANEDEQSSTVTRNNMLRMIAAMSIRGYGYDPRNPRNQATADIVSDLQVLGMAMTDETVLKYIKAAAKFVPPGALANAVVRKPKSVKRKPKSD